MPFGRNTKAEDFKRILIPKDSTYVVGIESIDVFLNVNDKGDFKGRNCDKYKMVLRVLEPGDYFDARVKCSMSAQIERREGATGVETIAYGNSKRYCQVIQAIDPSIEDEKIPSPESDDDIESFAERTFIGKIFHCTFGTYSWDAKVKDPKPGEPTKETITINTIKEGTPLGEEMEEAIKGHIDAWMAGAMTGRIPGGTQFDEEMFK